MATLALSDVDDDDDGTRPWADLPVELVDAVVEHLDLFSTTWLAGVCTSWAAAVAANAALPFGKPCLLMSTEADEEWGAPREDYEEWSFRLMDLTRERIVSFPALIWPVWWQWWVGAKGDWLAVMDGCGDARLLNLYTWSFVSLPNITAVWSRTAIGERNFPRIVVCETPSDGDGDYLVIAMDAGTSLLEIARGGDESWTALTNPRPNDRLRWSDAVLHKGKVFAVDTYGSVHPWDIERSPCPDPEEPAVRRPDDVVQGVLWQYLYRWRLAESADGRRLLLVCVYGKMAEYCVPPW